MAAIWTLCRSYLLKNKLQNLFIALLILLSTLLVSTSAVVMSGTSDTFSKVHDKTRGSHQILMLEKGLHNPEFIHEWWASQSGVHVSKLLPYHILSGITFNGKDISNFYPYMMETPAPPFVVDELIFTKGLPKSVPDRGTVWIPTSMANTYGISQGDPIGFRAGMEELNLEVSAVVIDVPFGAPFSNSARIWMNNDDYAKYIAPLSKDPAYMMGIRFDEYRSNMSYWDRFTAELGSPFLETKKEFESISSFYLIINRIVSFIMIFLGMVMLLVALITIGYTLSDAILANYKSIGVMKSLGLTTRSTISTYIMQYSILALIGIIPGLALSTLLSRVLINLSVSSLRTDSTGWAHRGVGISLLIGLLILGLIMMYVSLYAGKSRRVEPAQAIRYGMSELDNSKAAARMNAGSTSKLGFGHLPLTAVIGLRQLIKNRRGSILMLVMTLLTTSVLVLSFTILNSISGIQHTAGKWGYDSADVAVIVINKANLPQDKLTATLFNDPRIESSARHSTLTGIVNTGEAAVSESSGNPSLSIPLSILDGDYDQMGFETLTGSNPRHKNEISLGVNVANTLDKQLGDVIDVYIEGKKQTLIVTGIYQSIANSSYTARVTIDAVRTVQPAYNEVDEVFINVKDLSQADAVVSDLNRSFKDSISVVTQETLLNSVFNEAARILIYPLGLVGLLFVMVTFIIIYSSCRIHIRKEARTLGIYKSIGLTSNRIRWSIALGVIGLSTIGALLGMMAGLYLLPLLLEKVLAVYGIVHLPVIHHWAGIVLMASGSVLFSALASWASSITIQKLSPRLLVVE